MTDGLDRAIDAHAEAAFSFLEALVRARSVVGSEQAAMEVFASEAESLGLAVRRLPFSNDRMADARAGVAPRGDRLSPDRYQVVAETPGDGALLLLLNGHMDVVPAESPDLWTTPPFAPQRRNGRLYGRGAGDMKSGFAVGMLALRALRDVAPDLFAARRLGFLAVVEEECTGNGTLSSISEHGVTAAEVVVLEPTDLDLLVGGVGVLWVDIDVATPSGHAYAAEAHASAVDLGMRLVDGLRQWSAELARSAPEPSMHSDANPYNVNLGRLHAGDWTSTVPSRATFGVRIGFPRAWSVDRAADEIRKLIASAGTSFLIQPRVTLSGFRARGYLLESDSDLVRDLGTAHRDAHGVTPLAFTIGSTTDARIYINDFGIPAVCFGAIAHDIHGIDESVELQSIVDAARTLARFLLIRFAASEVAR